MTNSDKIDISNIHKDRQLLYEYIRGSHMYGLNTPESDIDKGGVYFCSPQALLGFDSNYKSQIGDSKSDIVYYEIKRWFELLLKSNPTVLEGLFAPENCILAKSEIISKIIENREMFLTKKCFNAFYGQAVSQVLKARGLNKKITNPVTEKKSVLDFCYVPYKQGSKKVVDWLADYGMKQKYCGLVLLPNMHDTYGLYYDWVTHFLCEFDADLHNKNSLYEILGKILVTEEERYCPLRKGLDKFLNAFDHRTGLGYYLYEELPHTKPYGFTGIVSENAESNEVRTCAVPKDIEPITYMTYNKSGYESHCRDYKEYKEWEKNRNPVRYESNLDKNYDSKNMMHCIRLIRMAKELAKGEGFNVVRTYDRDFLLDIRNHKYEYDEIIKIAEEEKQEMNEAIKTCRLPETINVDEVNKLLIDCRKIIYDLNGKF